MRLHVLSSLQEGGDDILITFEEDDNTERAAVTGITFNKNQARIGVRDVPDKPDVAYQILDAVADASIEVDVTIQSVGSENTTDFSFTVPRSDYRQTIEVLQQRQDSIGAAYINDDDTVCKISAVGLDMRSHVGVAVKVLRTLAEKSISIQIISTSGIKVSVLISEEYIELTTHVLHKALDLGS